MALMKSVCVLLLEACGALAAHAADERIYRCGNAYTNTVTEADSKNCKLISSSNVTVIQSVTPPAAKAQAAGSKAPTPEQRAKDADARLILESELKKAEARQAETLKEYKNGEPERLGPEARNNQKYLDRVATLKAAVARNASDMASIQRELDRLAPAPTDTPTASPAK